MRIFAAHSASRFRGCSLTREANRGGNYEREHRHGAGRLRCGSSRLLLYPSWVCEGVGRVRGWHGGAGVAPGFRRRGPHELKGRGRLLRDPGPRAQGQPCSLHRLPALRDDVHPAKRWCISARRRPHPRARRLQLRLRLGVLRRHLLFLRVADPRLPHVHNRSLPDVVPAWGHHHHGTCPW